MPSLRRQITSPANLVPLLPSSTNLLIALFRTPQPKLVVVTFCVIHIVQGVVRATVQISTPSGLLTHKAARIIPPGANLTAAVSINNAMGSNIILLPIALLNFSKKGHRATCSLYVLFLSQSSLSVIACCVLPS